MKERETEVIEVIVFNIVGEENSAQGPHQQQVIQAKVNTTSKQALAMEEKSGASKVGEDRRKGSKYTLAVLMKVKWCGKHGKIELQFYTVVLLNGLTVAGNHYITLPYFFRWLVILPQHNP